MVKRAIHNLPNGNSARQLLETFTAEEAAEILGISTEDVINLAKASGFRLPEVVIICLKTGRRFRARGWLGAYRKIQILGLTEWGWWTSEVLAAWEAKNGPILFEPVAKVQ